MKKALRQVRDLEFKRDSAPAKIRAINDRLTSITPSLSEHVSGGSSQRKLEDGVAQMDVEARGYRDAVNTLDEL